MLRSLIFLIFQHHLAQDRSGDEDEDLDLESPFTTATQVEVEATVAELTPVQVRRVVDLPDGLSAEIDIENPNNTLTPYQLQNTYL